MRRVAKTDANQQEIMDALREAGAEVTSLHQVGGGVPDLLVSYRNKWYLIEVKDGSKPPSARMLTDDQRKWMVKQHASVWVVNSPAEALDAIGAPQCR